MSPTFRELLSRAHHEPAVPTVRIETGGRTSPYGAAVLAAECATVESLPPDSYRNTALNRAAFKIARLVPHEIAPEDAYAHLYASGRRCGLPDGEVRDVLRESATGALPKGQEHQREVAHAEPADVPDVTWRPSPGSEVALVEDHRTDDVTPDGEEDGEVERTSWWTRDLADVLAGEDVEPDPCVLQRLDDVSLFYPGRVNVLLGESESGKTWVALLAVLQHLRAEGRVLYLDFEDSPGSVVGRLRSLGATDGDLVGFAYVNPDEPLSAKARRDLGEVLDLVRPSLVVLDGWNAAMGLLGLNLTDNADATAFHQQLLRPLSRAGEPPPCVLAIDHVPKAVEARGKGGIGAQAKRGMVDGCSVRVEVEEPFGRGMVGRLRLTVDKDRPGKVREHAQGAVFVGSAVLSSNASTGAVSVVIEAPGLDLPSVVWDPIVETMAQASGHLVDLATRPGAGIAQNQLAKLVPARHERLVEALDRLVQEGYVRTWDGPKNGRYRTRLYESLRPYGVTKTTPGEGSSGVLPVNPEEPAETRREVLPDRVRLVPPPPLREEPPDGPPAELPLDLDDESTP